MPNKDGTGPRGKGPRTGRGRGDCPKKTEGMKQLENKVKLLSEDLCYKLDKTMLGTHFIDNIKYELTERQIDGAIEFTLTVEGFVK